MTSYEKQKKRAERWQYKYYEKDREVDRLNIIIKKLRKDLSFLAKLSILDR